MNWLDTKNKILSMMEDRWWFAVWFVVGFWVGRWSM